MTVKLDSCDIEEKKNKTNVNNLQLTGIYIY